MHYSLKPHCFVLKSERQTILPQLLGTDEWWIKLFIIYETRKNGSDHIVKHRNIFDKLRSVWENGQTLSRMFDKSSQFKLKLKRKQRNKRENNECVMMVHKGRI